VCECTASHGVRCRESLSDASVSHIRGPRLGVCGRAAVTQAAGHASLAPAGAAQAGPSPSHAARLHAHAPAARLPFVAHRMDAPSPSRCVGCDGQRVGGRVGGGSRATAGAAPCVRHVSSMGGPSLAAWAARALAPACVVQRQGLVCVCVCVCVCVRTRQVVKCCAPCQCALECGFRPHHARRTASWRCAQARAVLALLVKVSSESLWQPPGSAVRVQAPAALAMQAIVVGRCSKLCLRLRTTA
jgi:hypothetical protein